MAGPILARPGARGAPLQEMVIYGVSFDMVGKQPIVLLKAVDTNKFLPIWIGHPEAAAILMKLQGASTPRPMTHDLLFDMLGELDVQCSRVSVTELRENNFYPATTPTTPLSPCPSAGARCRSARVRATPSPSPSGPAPRSSPPRT